MEDWLRISLILCIFGFCREMRPSEPFATEFLSGEWRNITAEQVNRIIYPWGTYSYLAQLVIIFLITDILRYKPIIILSSCAGIGMFSLLLWTYDLLGLQFTQLFYGTFMSSEIAYYTYIYAKVERKRYQQVTGHTRSAYLSGRFVAGVLAQFFVSYQILDYRQLNFISFAAQLISLIVAFTLPSVDISLYFYNNNSKKLHTNLTVTSRQEQKLTTETDNSILNSTNQTENKQSVDETNHRNEHHQQQHQQHHQQEHQHEEQQMTNYKPKFSCHQAIQLIWHHIYVAYSNPIVVQWSIWWSLAMCGFLLVVSYVQLLWQQIDPNHQSFYNGAVEAVVTLLGAIGAFLAGFLNHIQYAKWDIWILVICSILESIFLIISAFTNSIELAYLMYILFGGLYYFMITIASATVATQLIEDSFGLIFGINTLFALIFQSILTVILVSDDGGLKLDPRGQNLAFGGYFFILSLLYCVVGICLLIKRHPCFCQSKINTNL